MEILKKLKSSDYWQSKLESIILVEKQADIEPLWKLLCEQDDYWESYKHLIEVAPKSPIDSEYEISKLCGWNGKTKIYDVKSLQEKIPFFIYQIHN